MAADVGRPSDRVALLASLEEAPWDADLFQVLRRLEGAFFDKPRLGHGRRRGDEPIRFGQAANLTFAPAALAAYVPGGERTPPRLLVHSFGLLGPDGPLPLHLTEYVRGRLREGDPTLARFLDLFHHRLLTLFYRAWADALPHVHRDRAAWDWLSTVVDLAERNAPVTVRDRDAELRRDRLARDGFTTFVGSFAGHASTELRGRDALPDEARLFHAGTLARQIRNAEGLESILSSYLGRTVRIEQFVGHWIALAPQDRTRLGGRSFALGHGALVGGRVWDRQHKFRIHVGPLPFAEYEQWLPGGPLLRALVDWVRAYLGFELDWDIRLVLRASEVPAPRLGRKARLGWTAWLRRPRVQGSARRSGERDGDSEVSPDLGDPGDVYINPEAVLRATGEALA